MIRISATILLLITLGCFPTILISQEVQLKFCDGSLTIDNARAKKVTLLNNFDAIIEVSVYKLSDDSKFIEIKYLKSGDIIREKRPITEEELSFICEELSTKISDSRQDEADFGKMGRKRLIGSSMLTSLGYYGWAIPFALDATNGESYTASYMIIGSAGFFIPFLSTRNKEVSLGMAKGYRSGSLLGIAHGWALSGAIFGNDIDPNLAFGISTFTSIGEGLLGYNLAKKNNWNYNKVSCVSMGGYWGLGEGAALSYILNFEDRRIQALTVLGISGLGMYGGYVAGDKYKLSNGSLTVINTLGLLGAYIPLGIISTLETDFNRGIAGILAASSIVGLGYGIYHTNGVNYSRQQGNMVGLGTIAGSLAGSGVTVLMGSESAIITTIGAVCGFIITDKIIRKDIGKAESKSNISMNIDFNPYPLMMSKQTFSKNLSNKYLAENNYLVKLRVTF